QHRIGLAFEDAVGQVLQVAHAARGDHRNAHRLADRTGDAQVEAVLHAVLVHAGQQDLAGTQLLHLPGPLHGIQPGGLAAAMGEDLPARALARGGDLLGVDGHHDALGAEALGGLADEFRVEHRGGIDGHLVGAGIEQVADVLHGAHAAAHGQRNEHLAGHALHGVQGGGAVVDTGGDVQEGDLVGALLVVAAGDLHRVAGVADVLELDALHHAAVVHVEAGNDAFGQCHAEALSNRLRRTSAALRGARSSPYLMYCLVAARHAPCVSEAARSLSEGFSARLTLIQSLKLSHSAWASATPRVPSQRSRPVMAPMMPGARASSSFRMSPRLWMPPEAITGMRLAAASAAVASTLQPCIMPSLAMSV